MSAQATRFLVWRAYHRLREDLGRIPTASEVGNAVDISRSHAGHVLRSLRTCQTRRSGHTERVYVEGAIAPVDTFIHANGGA